MQDWLVPLARIMERLEATPEGKRFHYPDPPRQHAGRRYTRPVRRTTRRARMTRTSSTS